MDFIEAVNHLDRLCNTFFSDIDCTNCPLKDGKCSTIYLKANPNEVLSIITKWAEENPIKTNAQKFKEVFGVEVETDDFYKSNCDGIKCPAIDCDKCEYYGFWNKEYIEK